MIEVILPNSIIKIGNNAFYSCDNLKQINIPQSVTNIGRDVFQFCFNLTNVELSSKVMGENEFYGCSNLEIITIPKGITRIPQSAFMGCTKLKSIGMPNSLTAIQTQAFYGCASLEEITIPNSLTFIGQKAFAGCNSLEEITIPKSVIYINDNAFSNCIQLKTVIFNSEFSYYGSFTSFFDNTPALYAINIDPDNSLYSSKDGVVFNKDMTSLLYYPQGKANITYTIPDSVTVIEPFAFHNCQHLQYIIFPDELLSITDGAFKNCSNLMVDQFPNSLSYIGNNAFENCKKITNLTFSPNLDRIRNNAFSGCPLESLTIMSSPSLLGGNAFGSGISISSIYIPTCSVYAIQWFEENGFEDALVLTPHPYKSIITTIPSLTQTGHAKKQCPICGDVLSQIDIPALNDMSVMHLPNMLKTIEDEAFSNLACQAIIIPESCTSIGEYAFAGCTNLLYVRIPVSVKKYPVNAFEGCDENLVVDWELQKTE